MCPLYAFLAVGYAVRVPSFGGRDRVKIGWTDKFTDRLSTYRSVIPDLHVLALWPTDKQWTEKMALLRASQIGVSVFAELFEFDDTAAAVKDLNRLFGELGICNTHRAE
jgi:hypothetical protein